MKPTEKRIGWSLRALRIALRNLSVGVWYVVKDRWVQGEHIGRVGGGGAGRIAYVYMERLVDAMHWDLVEGRERSNARHKALLGAILGFFGSSKNGKDV